MGGLEALKEVVRHLPHDFKGSIAMVLHTSSTSPGVLDRVLSRVGPLPASVATDGESLAAGHIYVAATDHHLTLDAPGTLRVSRGPKENRFRPAIDPLFRSAAEAFGPRVVGVILTGFLDDGTAGLWAIKERGGTAIVQNPEEAVAPSMPFSALKHVEVNYCVRLAEMGALLVKLAEEETSPQKIEVMKDRLESEVRIARENAALEAGVMQFGEPSVFACPECHGVLLERKEGTNVRFRCHTGHAYGIDSLLCESEEQTEEMIWNAIRSLEETILLIRSRATTLERHQHHSESASHVEKADDAYKKAETLRKLVMGGESNRPILK